jgi:phytanoyl-CoA hydroxylase
MYSSITPTGGIIHVPETLEEDILYFSNYELDDAKKYYLENGYVVVRNLLKKKDCNKLIELFSKYIKQYSGKISRSNGLIEVNKFNENLFVMNALRNPHEHADKKIQQYIDASLEILSDRNVIKFNSDILSNDNIELITWNHFEGNPVTIPHHDCYFFGTDLMVGEVVGTWLALEDINPGAGRLYVYPGSHLLDIKDFANLAGKNESFLNPVDSGYQKLILDFLTESNLVCVAPLLQAGDVLFWDSRTIHGSLSTQQPEFSRHSLTAHYCLTNGRLAKKSNTKKLINLVYVDFPNYNIKIFIRDKLPFIVTLYQKYLKRLFSRFN